MSDKTAHKTERQPGHHILTVLVATEDEIECARDVLVARGARRVMHSYHALREVHDHRSAVTPVSHRSRPTNRTRRSTARDDA